MKERYLIAVLGARDTSHCAKEALPRARALGAILAEYGCITGGLLTTGFARWVIKGASLHDGITMGFSPASDSHEHDRLYHLANQEVTTTIYTGFGDGGAELIMMRSADALIFGCGTFHSIQDFILAHHLKKPIGILAGDWDHEEILQLVEKAGHTTDMIIVDTDPRRLVDQIRARIRIQHTTA